MLGTKAVNAEDQRTFSYEEPSYERKARYAQKREREIGTKRRYIPIATVTKDNSNKLN